MAKKASGQDETAQRKQSLFRFLVDWKGEKASAEHDNALLDLMWLCCRRAHWRRIRIVSDLGAIIKAQQPAIYREAADEYDSILKDGLDTWADGVARQLSLTRSQLLDRFAEHAERWASETLQLPNDWAFTYRVAYAAATDSPPLSFHLLYGTKATEKLIDELRQSQRGA